MKLSPKKSLRPAPWHRVPPAAMARLMELFQIEIGADGRLPTHGEIQFDPRGREVCFVILHRGSVQISYAVEPGVIRAIGNLLTGPVLRPVAAEDVRHIDWKPKAGRAA